MEAVSKWRLSLLIYMIFIIEFRSSLEWSRTGYVSFFDDVRLYKALFHLSRLHG